MAPKADDFFRGLVFLMLSLFLFALMDAVQRILSRDYPLGLLLWIRFAFIFVFGIFMVGPRNLGGAIRSKIPWLQFGRSLMLVIEMGAFILAFRYLPIGDVHAIAPFLRRISFKKKIFPNFVAGHLLKTCHLVHRFYPPGGDPTDTIPTDNLWSKK